MRRNRLLKFLIAGTEIRAPMRFPNPKHNVPKRGVKSDEEPPLKIWLEYKLITLIPAISWKKQFPTFIQVDALYFLCVKASFKVTLLEFSPY